jgi:hypothetical protein
MFVLNMYGFFLISPKYSKTTIYIVLGIISNLKYMG